MRLSLRARFAVAAGVLVLLAATAVAAGGYFALKHSLENQATRVAKEEAQRLAGIVDTGQGEQGGESTVGGNFVDIHDPSLVGQLARHGAWVIVLGPGRKRVQATPGTPSGIVPPHVVTACERNGAAATSVGAPAAKLACHRAGSAGLIVVANPLADVERSLAAARRALGLAVLVCVLASFALAWLVGWRASRPLRLIAQAARSIREGDLSRRIGYRGRDDLGQLAAELDASFAELEGALRRQEQFTADASHELKTPLAAARSNVQLLRRWAAEDPVVRAEALAALERSTARMARIVADLIQLTHGDDRLRYAREPVRLDDLVLEAQRDARPLVKNAELVVESIEQATVTGDRDRLLQLLANLIDNALRASPAGGPIRLTLRTDHGIARLSVADDGPGIPEAELPRIFDRFFRGGAETGSGSGSGLGLAIARTIARAHDGDIEVAAPQGGGSVFMVSLPLAEEFTQSSSVTHRTFIGRR